MHLSSSDYHLNGPAVADLLFAIEGLSFVYPDGNQALTDIALSISKGDRIALVGKNGSGKSTLVKHLNGLLPLQSGSLRYREKKTGPSIQSVLRQEIGILFQDPENHLFCNTIFENVAFGPMNQGRSRDEVEELVRGCLETVGLSHLMYKPAHLLSYGQKKRAALASILVMKPEVLILDEPTANLDPKQERILKELLAGFPGTLIIIDHDLLFLYDICERAVVLADGRIHHDYSIRELVSSQNSLKEHGLDFTFRFACCGGQHKPAPTSPHQHYHFSHDHGKNGAHAPAVPEAPILELQHFNYQYPDGTIGISDINLIVYPGETLAVVGENGAGKSTLAACLLGLNHGEGYFFSKGKKMDCRLHRALWRQVGMVFQNTADQLFCPSCWEEVAFGPQQMKLPAIEIKERVAEALHSVQLTGYEHRIPLHLSGGERKRLAIAAALSMHPEILLLDEPTASLDPKSQELLLKILEKLDMTKIIITHDMFFIRNLSKRTIVMHQGRIIRDYPTPAFLADKHIQASNGLDYTYKNTCLEEIMDLQRNHTAAAG
ncbi:MAG TPA: ABC transporter [Desulfobulbaceae bacterium]|nr:ABC transporter [Desulfobulbaceae bacterium]